MKNTWQLQEAKNRLSEVVDQALHQGHQTITRRGKPAAVVLSVKEFHRMRRKKESLLEFFAPLKGTSLDLKRDPSLVREVAL